MSALRELFDWSHPFFQGAIGSAESQQYFDVQELVVYESIFGHLSVEDVLSARLIQVAHLTATILFDEGAPESSQKGFENLHDFKEQVLD